jgi:hypothetical protein
MLVNERGLTENFRSSLHFLELEVIKASTRRLYGNGAEITDYVQLVPNSPQLKVKANVSLAKIVEGSLNNGG